ncbi:TfoX/Sxy family DNA transformation protein [Ethanoligenens harbinense]
MGELAKLVNIGPDLEQQLAQVGVTTLEELKTLGSREAWRRIRAIV